MSRRWGWSRRYERTWPRYVPVAERRETAARRLAKLVKQGEKLDPVVLDGRAIARTFWGKGWCDHLEDHCDFWNRLGRGRSYVRNGSVCDLAIEPGKVRARVVGNDLYRVEIDIKKLPAVRWKAIREASTGHIASVVELLRGRLSDAVMRLMTDPKNGLFPRRNEIELKCSCPDYAVMCKHVAATLYGVGARLDRRPELLFVLRGVDTAELFDEAVGSGVVAKASAGPAGLEECHLSEIFGVEIETAEAAGRGAAAEGTAGTEAPRKAGKARTARKARITGKAGLAGKTGTAAAGKSGTVKAAGKAGKATAGAAKTKQAAKPMRGRPARKAVWAKTPTRANRKAKAKAKARPR